MTEQASLGDISEGRKKSEESEHYELGKVPEDWSIVKLADKTEIEMGSSPKSKFYNEEGEGLPFFQGNNEFGKKYPEKEVWCSEPVKAAEKGDILISVRAPVGDLNIAKEKSCIGRGLAAISNKDLNREYLFYHLQERKKWLQRISAGSTYDSINSSQLKNLKLRLPEKDEQRRIASVLYNVDQAISKTEEIIEQTQRVKKGLMQDFFSEFDAVRRNQNPEDYSYESLGDLVEFNSGNAFKTKNLSDDGMKVVRISNLNDPDHDYWTYDDEYNEEWVVEDGDLLFTWAGLKTSIDVHIYRGEEALLNQHIYNLFPTEEIGKKYLYYYLGYVMPQLYATSSGGAKQMHLTKSQISKVVVPILDEEKRIEIVESLSSVDGKIRNLKEQKEQLQRLKKGLMQDLLTGSVRTGEDVEVLDEVVEEG